MRAKVFRLDARNPDDAVIRRVARILLDGGLAVVPTETVYGLVAHPDVPAAVARLYEAKKRSPAKPIALLAAGAGEVKACGAELGVVGDRLAGRFWPGPLTLVLKTGKLFEGYRVPDYPLALALLRILGGRLRATSANRSGERPAVTAEEARRAVGRYADAVLDAGPSPGGDPSTVLKVEDGAVEFLRVGVVSREAIAELLRGCERS